MNFLLLFGKTEDLAAMYQAYKQQDYLY